MAKSIWLMRTEGKVEGPFDKPQILELVKIGEIPRDAKLSTDQVNWKVASEIKGLLPTESDLESMFVGSNAETLGTVDVESIKKRLESSAEKASSKCEKCQHHGEMIVLDRTRQWWGSWLFAIPFFMFCGTVVPFWGAVLAGFVWGALRNKGATLRLECPACQHQFPAVAP